MTKPILNGAPNARDLGGMKTQDGRTLKYGRLIRSGMLGIVDAADIEYLKEHNLKKVVDLRTVQERMDKPNKVIEGVEYINCPIFEGKTEGITREEPPTLEEEAERSVQMAVRLMKKEPDGREQMRGLYKMLVTDEHAIEYFGKFFEILLRHEEGALLYHCMMGKDRVGTATALLLSALGVSREDIIKDYLLTGERCAPGTRQLVEACRNFTDDEAILKFVYDIDTVEESFINTALGTIEENCGSVEAFLEKKLNLDEAKIERLKVLYLE